MNGRRGVGGEFTLVAFYFLSLDLWAIANDAFTGKL